MPRTHVQEFDAARVKPMPGQPRKRFRGIRELADSIAEVGQLSPGMVTRIDGDERYDAQLIDGERRLKACLLAGVPFRAEVQPDAEAEEIFARSFAANFGKQDHDCVEVAEGLARMQAAGKTYEQMARIAGRAIAWVYQHLSLMKLHPDVRAMLIAGEDEEKPRLAFSVALTLTGLPHEQQLKMVNKIARKGLSLAATQRMVIKERAKAGDAGAYTQNNGSRRTIATIEAYLEHFGNRIGIFFDMPPDRRREAIDAEDHRTKRLVAEALEEMADNLQGFAEEIRRRLPTLANGAAVRAASRSA